MLAQERVLLHKAVTLKDLKGVSQMENRFSVYNFYKEIDYSQKNYIAWIFTKLRQNFCFFLLTDEK